MRETPLIGAGDISRLLRAELSFGVRMRYVIGLLGTTTFSVALLSLWLTEPRLPARTHVAFAVLVMINLSWMVFCLWVLSQRKTLYARQRVVAGRLAVLWTAVFSVGAVLAAILSANAAAGIMSAASGALLLGCAFVMLRRATTQHQRLLELRRSLEGGGIPMHPSSVSADKRP